MFNEKRVSTVLSELDNESNDLYGIAKLTDALADSLSGKEESSAASILAKNLYGLSNSLAETAAETTKLAEEWKASGKYD